MKYVLQKHLAFVPMPHAMKHKAKKDRGRPRRFAKRMVSLTVRVPSVVKRKLKTEGGAGVAIVDLVCERWPEIGDQL